MKFKELKKNDWSDIQSLLFREPDAALSTNLDMKLDELEKKIQ